MAAHESYFSRRKCFYWCAVTEAYLYLTYVGTRESKMWKCMQHHLLLITFCDHNREKQSDLLAPVFSCKKIQMQDNTNYGHSILWQETTIYSSLFSTTVLLNGYSSQGIFVKKTATIILITTTTTTTFRFILNIFPRILQPGCHSIIDFAIYSA